MHLIPAAAAIVLREQNGVPETPPGFVLLSQVAALGSLENILNEFANAQPVHYTPAARSIAGLLYRTMPHTIVMILNCPAGPRYRLQAGCMNVVATIVRHGSTINRENKVS